MTTIAYKDGIMAADQLVINGNLAAGLWTKIEKIDGVLVGAAGERAHCVMLRDWFRNGRQAGTAPDFTSLDVGFNAIIVERDGAIKVRDTNPILMPLEPLDGFYAIGSGGDHAIGAMGFGATAIEAVRFACRYDIRSAEPIDMIECAAVVRDAVPLFVASEAHREFFEERDARVERAAERVLRDPNRSKKAMHEAADLEAARRRVPKDPRISGV